MWVAIVLSTGQRQWTEQRVQMVGRREGIDGTQGSQHRLCQGEAGDQLLPQDASAKPPSSDSMWLPHWVVSKTT